MSDKTDDLLQILIHVTGRVAIPTDELRQLVAAGRDAGRQVAAYNLCDGRHTQGDITKALKLDSGNFSRTVKRWQNSGIVFRVGDEEQLLHVYPLT